MFIQLGIKTYFSFNNMPQTVSETKHSIEEGWLKKMKCMDMFNHESRFGGFLSEFFKGIYLSKALTCTNFFVHKKNCFLSRRQIPLATLLYEQFIHLSQITLHPNIQLLRKRQHAYKS